MNGLPRSWFSTTCVSRRLSKGKRRDSSVGLLAAAGLAGSGADGLGSEPQEISSAAAIDGSMDMRIRPQYNARRVEQFGVRHFYQIVETSYWRIWLSDVARIMPSVRA